MTPENQQKILKAIHEVFAEVSNALECKDFGYEDGIRFIRKYGNRTLSELLLDGMKKLLPSGSIDELLKPESLEAYLTAMDTWEKAEAVLLAMPEPDPRALDLIVNTVSAALPSLRQIILPIAKRLPHPPGGRPKKLSDPLKRGAIRDEIGGLLANGVDLRDAQIRLKNREGVSLSTIQRIWRERKHLRNNASPD